MRRRNAYLLMGGMLLTIAGYLCWSARPFLIRPGIQFEPDVPDKEKKIVNDWVKESGGFGPENFRWQQFINLLIHPYETAVLPAVASFSERDSYTPEHVVIIKHPHKPYIVRIAVDRQGSKFRITYH